MLDMKKFETMQMDNTVTVNNTFTMKVSDETAECIIRLCTGELKVSELMKCSDAVKMIEMELASYKKEEETKAATEAAKAEKARLATLIDSKYNVKQMSDIKGHIYYCIFYNYKYRDYLITFLKDLPGITAIECKSVKKKESTYTAYGYDTKEEAKKALTTLPNSFTIGEYEEWKKARKGGKQ